MNQKMSKVLIIMLEPKVFSICHLKFSATLLFIYTEVGKPVSFTNILFLVLKPEFR